MDSPRCVVSILLVVALTLGASVPGWAQEGEWRHYGGDVGSTKYSPLDQIDRDNVADLEIA